MAPNTFSLKLPESASALSIDSSLNVVSLTKGTKVRNCIVALHGYGDSAKNFSEVAREISTSDTLWLCPQAPQALPQSGGGAQWYDLFGSKAADAEKARLAIENLLTNASSALDLPLTKFFLLGFSQGAFLALYTGLRLKFALGGVLALNGYSAQAHRVELPLAKAVSSTPFFVAHGSQDQVVLPHSHFETLDILSHFGHTHVTSKLYPMGHSMCAEECVDIAKFIEANR